MIMPVQIILKSLGSWRNYFISGAEGSSVYAMTRVLLSSPRICLPKATALPVRTAIAEKDKECAERVISVDKCAKDYIGPLP